MTCLTGEPASATVTTTGDGRYFCIGTGRVRQLYNQNSDMKSALDAAFAAETGRKLRGARDELTPIPGKKVTDLIEYVNDDPG